MVNTQAMESTLMQIQIGERTVGDGAPVFFIAEAGVNHNGDCDLGQRLVDAAADAGADAVKFQTFGAERLCTRDAPKAQYHMETTGSEQSWFDLLKSQEMDRAMHELLIRRCRERRILFLSTPYDEESADLLEELDVPAFKIASTDANNIPFLRYVALKKRPMILSTGMCTMEEVRESVDVIRASGVSEVVVLHCTGNYPTPLEDTHMRVLRTLREELNVLVGYSDHTLESVNPVLAVALGAAVYEKHFTLDRSLRGPDHRMSLTPDQLAETIQLVRKAQVALGQGNKRVQPSEAANRDILRKSLVAGRDLRRGEVLTYDAVAIKRPGTGLAPNRIVELVGKRLVCDVPKDALLDTSFLERKP